MHEKPRILIVDDDEVTRDTLEGLLYPEGFEITFAESGSDAISMIEKIKPDTILLDVVMADMDGFEVCRTIKSKDKWRHIPIIMVTGLDSKEDISRGLDAGAEDFLHKPVNGLELRARVRSMLRIKRQFDELEETLLLREDLSNMVMHDMKNPLAAIVMACQLLQIKINIPEGIKFLDTIQTQSRRLETLMNDMLMLAKMKEGKLILNRAKTDINQFIQDVGNNHSGAGEARGIKLLVDLTEQSRDVTIDVNLFHRLFDNLLSNAFKFSPNESKIVLQVETSTTEPDQESGSQGIRIRVIDEGHGVPEEHRNDIFDKFKVVAMQRKGIPQFGLGLAFCKMVAEAHKGKIFVEPNDPQGSVFVVEI